MDDQPEKDLYDVKFKEMQKYIPFLEKMIEKLKKAHEKPREAQLRKMESLHTILTNSKKKLRIESLQKCEEVLKKLYEKVEQNVHTTVPNLQPSKSEVTSTSKSENKEEDEEIINNIKFCLARAKLSRHSDLTTPASPSPPTVSEIGLSKPILIPTERTADTTKRLWNPEPEDNGPWKIDSRNSANLPKPVTLYPKDVFRRNSEESRKESSRIQSRIETYRSNEKLTDRDKKSDFEIYKTPNPKASLKENVHNKFKWVNPDLKLANSSSFNEKLELNYNALSKNSSTPESPLKKGSVFERLGEKISVSSNEELYSSKSIVFSLPPVDPPLSSEDIAKLLSEPEPNKTNKTVEEFDILKLENMRETLVNEIKKLPDKKPAEMISKHTSKSDIKSPLKLKPKPPERVIKEADNIFGNLLSSIDDQIIQVQKKKDTKKDSSKKEITKKPADKDKNTKSHSSTKIDKVELGETKRDKTSKVDISKDKNNKSRESKEKDTKDKHTKDKNKDHVSDVKDTKSKSLSDSKDNIHRRKSSESQNKDISGLSEQYKSSKKEVKTDKHTNESSKDKEDKDRNRSSTKDQHPKESKSKSHSKDGKDHSHKNEKNAGDHSKDAEVKIKKDKNDSGCGIKKDTKDKHRTSEAVTKENSKDNKNESHSREHSKNKLNKNTTTKGNIKDDKIEHSDSSKKNCTVKDTTEKNDTDASNGLQQYKENQKKEIQLSRVSDNVANRDLINEKDENKERVKIASREKSETVSDARKVDGKVFVRLADKYNPHPRRSSVNDDLKPSDNVNSNTAARGLGLTLKEMERFLQSDSDTDYSSVSKLDNMQKTNSGTIIQNDPRLNKNRPSLLPVPTQQFPVPVMMNSTRPDMTNYHPRFQTDQQQGFQNTCDPRLLNKPLFERRPNKPMHGGNQMQMNINSFNAATSSQEQYFIPGSFPERRISTPLLPTPRDPAFHENFPSSGRHPLLNTPNLYEQTPRLNNPSNEDIHFNTSYERTQNPYDLSKIGPVDYYESNQDSHMNKQYSDANMFHGNRNLNDPHFSNKQPLPFASPIHQPSYPQFGKPIPNILDVGPGRRSFDADTRPVPLINNFPQNPNYCRGDNDFSNRSQDNYFITENKDVDMRFQRNNDMRIEPSETDSRYQRNQEREQYSGRIDNSLNSRDPRRRRFTDVPVRHKPEEKKFRGYDPRPRPRNWDDKDKKKTVEPFNTPHSKVLQNFKIPKIKKDEPVEVHSSENNCETFSTNISASTFDPEVEKNEKSEKDKSSDSACSDNESVSVKAEEEDLKNQSDVKEIINEIDTTQNPEISSNTEEHNDLAAKPSTNSGESKEDLINDFIRKICEKGETDTFFEVLEKLGESLHKKKFKKIQKIIESDSESEEDDKKDHLDDVKSPLKSDKSEVKELKLLEKSKDQSSVDTIDQAKTKSKKKLNDKNKNVDINLKEVTVEENAGKKSSSPQKRTRRRNALEMLHDDIRDMFICEGVITATGQRMCRYLKEGKVDSSISPDADSTSPEQVNRKTKNIVFERANPRKTRSRKVLSFDETLDDSLSDGFKKRTFPRVVLEKTDLSKLKSFTPCESSSDESSFETENIVSSGKACPVAKKSKEIKSKTESSTEMHQCLVPGGKARVFMERNIKGKMIKLKRRGNGHRKVLFLSKNIDEVVEKLFKSHKVNLKLLKNNLNDLFVDKKENKQKSVSSSSEIETKAKPVSPKKKAKKKKGAWSLGIIKKKNKKIASESKQDAGEINTSKENDISESALENTTKNQKTEKQNTFVYPDIRYFIGSDKIYECKLCPFNGKTIVHHYRSAHRDEEILISRLSPVIAKTCIKEANENQYDNIKQTPKLLRNGKRARFLNFCCRFCNHLLRNVFTDIFYNHLSSHTGEFRFGCSVCNYVTVTIGSLRLHYNYNHPTDDFKCNYMFENVQNVPIVFGYLCNKCNFTQLHKHMVEKHVNKYHSKEDVDIIKINLSAIEADVSNTIEDSTIESNNSLEDKSDRSISDSSEQEKNADQLTLVVDDDKKLEQVRNKERAAVDNQELIKNKPDNVINDTDNKEVKTKYKQSASSGSDLKQKNEKPIPSKPKRNKNENSTLNVSNKQINAVSPKKDNVFECPDTVLDENEIRKERLKKMQEVAESLKQPRRTALQFVDQLKSKLESNLHDSTNEPKEVEETISEISLQTPLVDAIRSKLNSVLKDSNNTELRKDSSSCDFVKDIIKTDKPSSLKDIGNENQKTVTNMEDQNNLVQETNRSEKNTSGNSDKSSFENYWSRLSINKSNSILNTIQRLSNVVNQNKADRSAEEETEHISDTEDQNIVELESAGPSGDIIIDIGPISARKLDQGILFYCSDASCCYSSENKEQFTNHVDSEHGNDFWDGDCNECEQIFKSYDRKPLVKDALNHLFSTHLNVLTMKSIKATTAEPESYYSLSSSDENNTNSCVTKPLIRMRRLSGDMLSTKRDDSSIEKTVASELEDTGGELRICNVRSLASDEITEQSSDQTSFLRIDSVVSLSTNIEKGLDNTTQQKTSLMENANSDAVSSGKTQKSPIILNHLLASVNQSNIVENTSAMSPSLGESENETTIIIEDQESPVNLMNSKSKPALSPSSIFTNQELHVKKARSLSPMLEPYKLCHFYKCMASECDYTTDGPNEFLQHLKCKSNVNEAMLCSYCVETAFNNDILTLIKHIQHEHGECRFQCGYCFFRSASQSLVESHQFIKHVNQPIRVYKLRVRTEVLPGLKILPYQQICLPYMCAHGCNKEFYLSSHFRKHLMDHQDLKKFKCHVCKAERLQIPLLLNHYTRHKIGLYQCLYCLHSSDYVESMKAHLINWHPNQIPKVLVRELRVKDGGFSYELNSTFILENLIIQNLEDGVQHRTIAIKVARNVHQITKNLDDDAQHRITTSIGQIINNIPMRLPVSTHNLPISPVPSASLLKKPAATVSSPIMSSSLLKINQANLVPTSRNPVVMKIISFKESTSKKNNIEQDDQSVIVLNDDDNDVIITDIDKSTDSTKVDSTLSMEDSNKNNYGLDEALVEKSNANEREKSVRTYSNKKKSETTSETIEKGDIIIVTSDELTDPDELINSPKKISSPRKSTSALDQLKIQSVFSKNKDSDSTADKSDTGHPGESNVVHKLTSEDGNEKTQQIATPDCDEPFCVVVHQNPDTTKNIENAIDPLNIDSDYGFDLNIDSSENSNDNVVVIKDIFSITHTMQDDQSVAVNTAKEDKQDIADVTSLDDIKHTGFTGKDLFKCGATNCQFEGENSSVFKDHMFVCDTSNDSNLFKCYHCKRPIKHLNSLVEHVRTHGTWRYGCSLCDYRAPVAGNVTKHMKLKHKISSTRTIPLNPLKSNQEIDLFVVCPQGKGGKLLKRKDSSKDLLGASAEVEIKTSYGPNEIEQLPRQAVYSQDVKCSLCSYTSKVRTNLCRHLQAHSNSEEVPTTAPINPVPCLEKNEKMFDKMVNLANSSLEVVGRMGGKSSSDKSDQSKNDKFYLSYEEKMKLPMFVPKNKRYVCGATGCSYLTVDESMFRCHLQALHKEDNVLKCLHCDEQIHVQGQMSVDKIVSHMRMHESRLYKCAYCSYFHYNKHVVDRHLADKHPEKVPHVQTVRESESDDPAANKVVETTPQPELKEFKPWKCGLCKFRTLTRNDIIDHAQSNHGVRSQYKCSLCQYRCSYDKNFEVHFNSKHPGAKVDMISVFYRTQSAVVESPVVESEAFDTTPLWTRNMPRVRHIRGILFDETPRQNRKSTKTSSDSTESTPNTGTESKSVDSPLKSDSESMKSPQKVNISKRSRRQVTYQESSDDSTDDVIISEKIKDDDASKPLGIPFRASFQCPMCNKFRVKSEREFGEHLCDELNYNRLKCSLCDFTSHNYEILSDHSEKEHGKKCSFDSVVMLPSDNNVESYILDVINFQKKVIGQNAEELTNLDFLYVYPPESSEIVAIRKSSEIEVVDVVNVAENSVSNENSDNELVIDEHLSDEENEKCVKRKPTPTNKNKCPHCDYTSKYPSDIKKHVVRHWAEKPLKCGKCEFKGYRPLDIVKHSHACHEGEAVDIVTVCDIAKIRILPVIRKRRRANDEDDNESEKKQAKIEDKEITVLDSVEVDAEVKQDDDFLYMCHYCPKRGGTLDEIKEHWNLIHKNARHNTVASRLFNFRIVPRNEVSCRGRIMCMYCGYRSTIKSVKIHHKSVHGGKPLSVNQAPFQNKPNVKIKCTECTFYSYNISIHRSHFNEAHPEKNFEELYSKELKTEMEVNDNYESKITDDLSKSSTDYYKCNDCNDIFGSISNHNKTCSSRSSDFSVVQMKNYVCPQCAHESESIAAMLDHVRGHVKPIQCLHCSQRFNYLSLVKHHCTKDHPDLEIKYTTLEGKHEEFVNLKSDLLIVFTNGDRRKYGDFKMTRQKRPAVDKITSIPSKISKVETEPNSSKTIVGTNKNMKMNCAKKSTTQTTTSFHPVRIQQVAKKSTSPIKKGSFQLPKKQTYPPEYSYYGTKPIDESEINNITTVMHFGGVQMKVNIPTLVKITNIFPKLVIKDLKSQVSL